ncbi:bile acid:sodium symporter [Pseudomonas haemolytica]|uniref:Arsenic resistance protein n=1 Tax=Pseudomonas haemolytica TaxID=2600065 RepID=A0A5P1DDF8_9PSED|nr:bile acid:sodium symporter [Pseudomonas haemolytica]MBJ2246336.1 bile acid:sodium symporter [Pseudomonas haemolytica]MBJ2274032.1 bile acid:sodium symporter [Pseudomonas haemolytica]MBK3448392.1 bile acid:sodium symporter [Pseudomonas haemolytica]MBK3461246.1 bile acid:sodium symporter [Pseudomonas haemolytica]MRJ38432.1 arsenic resistance protein [Pseudomonas haemolytica]
MTRDTLEHNQIPIYFVAVFLAVTFGVLAPLSAHGLNLLVTPAIAVLMYAMLLQIPFLDLRQGLGNKRFMAALLLANFILVPLLVWALTRGLVERPALLVGALLVLLTPCIDYVVVFTHIGKGDSRSMLAATPLLLLLQLVLLPVYLGFMLGAQSAVVVAAGAFVEAFVWLIVVPMILAVLTTSLSRHSSAISRWCGAWGWLPVPAMALVLFVVIAAQITSVVRDISLLLPVIPIYVAFVVLAPLMGILAARLFVLPASTARAVTFSASTRNSLVVLPLALALPEDVRGLAATAVILQTLVELVAELVYVRLIPAVVWPASR